MEAESSVGNFITVDFTLKCRLHCSSSVASKGFSEILFLFIGVPGIEAPILWPPNAESQLIGKDPDAGKD